MTTKPVRVLPADVYDTLELAAEAFGGIGGGPFYLDGDVFEDSRERLTCPNCAHGLALFAEGLGYARSYHDEEYGLSHLREALDAAGINASENDWGVAQINARKRRDENTRVTFEEWVAQFNIVRGE